MVLKEIKEDNSHVTTWLIQERMDCSAVSQLYYIIYTSWKEIQKSYELNYVKTVYILHYRIKMNETKFSGRWCSSNISSAGHSVDVCWPLWIPSPTTPQSELWKKKKPVFVYTKGRLLIIKQPAWWGPECFLITVISALHLLTVNICKHMTVQSLCQWKD